MIENTIPELVRRRIPATIFVVSDLLGAKPIWDTRGQGQVSSERLLSANQLQELPPDLITIGSRGLSHPLFPSVSEKQARIEVAESKNKLSRMLSREVAVFSFPYGAFNQRRIDVCRAAGYKRVFTILPKLAFAVPHEFVAGRIAVGPTDWPLEFRLKLLGAYRCLPSGIAAKRNFLSWAAIIVVTVHRIGILAKARLIKKGVQKQTSI